MKFLYPVPIGCIVTQSFAEHVHRARVNGWTNYNGGIDWAVTSGTSLVAAQAGTVYVARRDATGYGNHVRIEHQDPGEPGTVYQTIYGHMMDFAVQPGDRVVAGQVIGRSDNTGNSTGPHLHFELRKNGVAIDPAALLVTTFKTESPEWPPVVEPEPGPEPAEFPALPKARVTSIIGLNIRQGAGVIHPLAGYLPARTVVEVIRSVHSGSDIWLQIGCQQYIAMRHAGETYAVWE